MLFSFEPQAYPSHFSSFSNEPASFERTLKMNLNMSIIKSHHRDILRVVTLQMGIVLYSSGTNVDQMWIKYPRAKMLKISHIIRQKVGNPIQQNYKLLVSCTAHQKNHPTPQKYIIFLDPVYTIPFSFHIGLGTAIRYENFSCLQDAVFISYRIGFTPLSERFHLKTQKRYEAYRIGAFSCKQEANPI